MKTAASTLSRNAPCWCGSGKKYKKCHLGKEQKQVLPPEKKPKPKERNVIIKTEEQIEGIRKSSQLTKELLDMVEERITEGVTTNEID